MERRPCCFMVARNSEALKSRELPGSHSHEVIPAAVHVQCTVKAYIVMERVETVLTVPSSRRLRA